jgi:RNA polymerase sigma-70 factor (ECF subfamily)
LDHYRRTAGRIAEAEDDAQTEPAGRPDPVGRRYFSPKGLWRIAVASWKAPEQALEDREFWDVLDGCLGRLPRSLSTVFILRELEGLDMAELRRDLSLSDGNLRVRLHRARLLLRECLEKHWFGDDHGGSRRTP